IVLMIIGAIYSWFRGWTLTFILIGTLFLNYLSQTTELFAYKNFAYGLDYNSDKADYSTENIEKLATDSASYASDKIAMLEILNHWKRDYETRFEHGKKPKLILICTSGGGLRSALWTYNVLQSADSICNGELFANTRMITGSSGGMIGASYYRELYLRKKKGEKISLCNPVYRDRISDDILNPVSFTIATSDMFIRFQKFSDGPYSYTKDRGYMFEKYLDKNLGGVFGTKRLYEYRVPEENADIPMMVFSPVIINHGRKLIISAQPVSFFTHLKPTGNIHNTPSYGNIEFTRFFKNQNAQNIRYTSVLRMNATFPYVMPMVTLPSEPMAECMDAGLRDNYGSHLAVHFLFEFRNWIEHNTSGVIVLNIRDRQKKVDMPRSNQSLYKRLIKPASNVVDNIFFAQDFDDDYFMYYLQSILATEVNVIDLCLRHDEKHKVSLSWHLTRLEKEQVLNSIKFDENKEGIERLRKLLIE
ncbi:MAG: patatin-like phospholipase family protein, partial [Flavobacteriales bacterium]